jgi:hypothetical protein
VNHLNACCRVSPVAFSSESWKLNEVMHEAYCTWLRGYVGRCVMNMDGFVLCSRKNVSSH